MVNKNYWLRICVGFFGVLLGSMAMAAPVPQRIVSLGSFVTEELYRLGVADRLVGVTTYCVRPQPAREKEKVGTIVDVNIEKIVALKPDVVIATPLTNARAREQLKNLRIPVVELPQVRDLSGICDQFLLLGEVVGKSAEAREIVRQAREKVVSLQQRVAGLPRLKVFIQVGTNPLFTMNKDFFIDDLIRRAGGINIAREASSGIYSRESVIAADPDVIVIATMGVAGDDEKRQWQKYPRMSAVRGGRIYCVDPYVLCDPTPDNFVAALECLIGFFHPQDGGR
ncbi:MAG: ABC transporter substrate-binding protein [Candidatus Omnitrophica bacterium]|nr:ABC transporter substrate-binding protein [Candidatus Omnitrophota bacterium]